MSEVNNNADENIFPDELRVEPLSRKTWTDFENLFGERGACGHCWCMSFRLSKKEFEEGKLYDGNKDAMKKLVWEGKPSGLLGFYGKKPIAWCAFAPREYFPKIERSRIHKRIDEQPVWSIPCIFIDRRFRRRQVSQAMLKGVISYAREKQIAVLEAYPAIPTTERLPDAFLWVGLYKSFQRAGFEIADRRSPNRPMVRYYTGK
jgi:hypothetical protein